MGPIIEGKSCLSCHVYKPSSDYSKHRSRKDGLQALCKVCQKIANRRWVADNPEKVKEQRARWRKNNPERARAKDARDRAAHPERCKERKARWRAANLEHVRTSHRQWCRSNRDVDTAHRHAARARKHGVDGRFTAAEWQELKARSGYTCVCCRKSEPEIKLTVDHIIPTAEGGQNSIDNIQPLCLQCNQHKHTRHIDYRNQQPTT